MSKPKANILVINMDIIMYPCIRLYEHFIHDNRAQGDFWDRFIYDINLNDKLSYDAHLLEEIANLLKRFKHKPVIDLDRKSDIIDYLHHIHALDDNPMLIRNIYNIGFHHDMGYNKEDYQRVFDHKKYDNKTWFGYLSFITQANTVWFKDNNSAPMEIKKSEFGSLEIYNARNMCDIPINKPDIIFLVADNMLPYKYTHLKNILLNIPDIVEKGGILFE